MVRPLAQSPLPLPLPLPLPKPLPLPLPLPLLLPLPKPLPLPLPKPLIIPNDGGVTKTRSGSALLPAMQGGVEAGTWPARPSIYEAKAGHQGRAEGQVATWLRWGQPYTLRRCLSPRLLPAVVTMGNA